MSNNFKLLVNIINYKLKFINDNFKLYIINTINNFFPLLNEQDKYILNILTIYLIDLICYKYHFKNELKYYDQWKQNNNRDIKSTLLLLLPFIDDKNNNKLLNNLTDLNHLLYSKNEQNISNSLLNIKRDESLFDEYFKFGNMGIGLLDENNNTNILLNLYDDNNDKLIYKIIYHNFLGLLQSLEIMNGKYYVNWINIVPYNLNNYYTSTFFTITEQTVTSFKDNINKKILSNLLLNYNGLWIGDYYNILKIKFYEDLKKIKWLIFPYETKTEKYYLINKLNNLLDLDFIISCNYNNYYELSENEKLIFIKKCKLIDITIDNNYEIIKYLLIYLINNNNNNIFNNYIHFKLDVEEDNTIEEYDNNSIKIIKKITNKLILSTFQEIINNNISELWNFLNDIIKKLKYTSIYKYLVTNNKINNKYYYEPFNTDFKLTENYNNNIKKKINLKNIYNIAKSLSHNNLNKWNKLSDNYLSLNINEKINFFIKINSNNYEEWISLFSNLKRQIYNFDTNNYNNKMIEILNAFKQLYHILIFEELITNGLLNYFNVNLNITNKQLLHQNDKKMKKQRILLTQKIFKEEYNESYYYLTNDKYKNLNKIKSNHKIKVLESYNEYNYFELIYDQQEWIFFYAMDWISQINFFHHYIYHQVLYVTGATGQGKSTQLPKLLLYALKVIDYKSNGKVICTEPRIPPTIGNSSRISVELGVPLDEIISNSSIKLKTNNYYVQYKHSEDQHINNNIYYGFIKISTDGTLFEELKSNLMMKKKIKIKNEYKYINENIYDIIMVDESHEHGTNMDLILTLSRYTCFINNQIRLVITSATMDDDEPIYRRYFKMINDKLLFPIKNRIIDPFTYNFILLNPEYMDRRYHISPPGETTQYKVDEFYLDDNNKIIENATIKQISDQAQIIGYEKVIEICNKYPTGEILFFANGMNEILKAVKYLNKHIPNDDIALPYFSELHANYKEIIEKIDTKIATIKNKKENIDQEWNNFFNEDKTVINGIYKRAIIIATNIAEASLTIPRLTFVIDNGYAKVNKYNEVFNQNILEVDLISEASRLQRKGRVGRLSDGQVFYIYKKDERKYVKPKYKITQENFARMFIDLLKTEDNKFYILYNFNPNLMIFNNILKKKESIEIEIIIEMIPDYFNSNLYTIHSKNYLINELNYEDYYINIELTNNIYINGLSFIHLLDIYCDFYLIHYFENDIVRNILNKIIYLKDKNINQPAIQTSFINQYQYKYILINLLNCNLIVEKNATILHNKNYELSIDFNKDERKYIKSELYNYIKFLLKYDYINNIENAITLLFSYLLKCYNEVFDLLIIFNIIKSLNELTFNYDKFKQIYLQSNIGSDIILIYNIINDFKSFFNKLLIFSEEITYNNILIDVNEVIFNIYNKTNNKYILNKINLLKRNNLLYNQDGTINYNSLNNSKLFYKESNIYKIIINNIENNKDEIIKWCSKNYIDSSFIFKYLNKLVEIKFENHINIIYDTFITYNLSDLLASLLSYNKEDNIIKSFLYGNPTNICYFINNKMISFNYDIFTINNINNLNFNELNNMNNILFYLFYDINSDILYKEYSNYYDNKSININIVNNIDIKWLISALPLYYNSIIFNKNYGPQSNPSSYITNINTNNLLTYNFISNDIINNWNENMIIWNNTNFPILNNYYKKILKSLKNNYFNL
jgi:hypothetical protein